MRLLEPLILLIACLGGLYYFVRNDTDEYARFKLLTDTRDRQSRYRIWILRGLLLFALVPLISLAVLGRISTLLTQPVEFAPLSEMLRQRLPRAQMPSPGFLFGFAGALLAGLAGGLVFAKVIKRGSVAARDILPLMPRNGPETAHTAILSINAGLGEELFFRLLLPLLLTLVFGHPAVGFVLATLIFGGMHRYQGIVGVLVTTILGAGFAVIYLWTRSLWIVVAGHALLDLFGLVVRPSLGRLFNRKPEIA
ncbi:MAG TPA: CPBP family intramembrane glutamic endopeptidase [Acidisarcina sp.]